MKPVVVDALHPPTTCQLSVVCVLGIQLMMGVCSCFCSTLAWHICVFCERTGHAENLQHDLNNCEMVHAWTFFHILLLHPKCIQLGKMLWQKWLVCFLGGSNEAIISVKKSSSSGASSGSINALKTNQSKRQKKMTSITDGIQRCMGRLVLTETSWQKFLNLLHGQFTCLVHLNKLLIVRAWICALFQNWQPSNEWQHIKNVSVFHETQKHSNDIKPCVNLTRNREMRSVERRLCSFISQLVHNQIAMPGHTNAREKAGKEVHGSVTMLRNWCSPFSQVQISEKMGNTDNFELELGNGTWMNLWLGKFCEVDLFCDPHSVAARFCSSSAAIKCERQFLGECVCLWRKTKTCPEQQVQVGVVIGISKRQPGSLRKACHNVFAQLSSKGNWSWWFREFGLVSGTAEQWQLTGQFQIQWNPLDGTESPLFVSEDLTNTICCWMQPKLALHLNPSSVTLAHTAHFGGIVIDPHVAPKKCSNSTVTVGQQTDKFATHTFCSVAIVGIRSKCKLTPHIIWGLMLIDQFGCENNPTNVFYATHSIFDDQFGHMHEFSQCRFGWNFESCHTHSNLDPWFHVRLVQILAECVHRSQNPAKTDNVNSWERLWMTVLSVLSFGSLPKNKVSICRWRVDFLSLSLSLSPFSLRWKQMMNGRKGVE